MKLKLDSSRWVPYIKKEKQRKSGKARRQQPAAVHIAHVMHLPSSGCLAAMARLFEANDHRLHQRTLLDNTHGIHALRERV